MYHPEEADIGLPMDLPQKTDGTEAAELRTQVLEFLPALRAFARSLTRNRTEADDLVQETLLKALSNIDKFDPGTNLRAWLFTILRNTYYTEIRKRRRENDGMSTLAQQDTNMGPAQEWAVTLKTLKSALRNCRATSAKRSSWSGPPACPMRKPPKSAAAPSAPSRAESTAPAPSFWCSWALTPPPTWWKPTRWRSPPHAAEPQPEDEKSGRPIGRPLFLCLIRISGRSCQAGS